MEETYGNVTGNGVSIPSENPGACIYRQHYSFPTQGYQWQQKKDCATTATTQTTSTTLNLSSSESSAVVSLQDLSGNLITTTSTTPQANRIIIETELSNLTESPSVKESDRETIGGRNATICGELILLPDQIAASMIRLYQLELKKNVLRYRRFILEQRLHNIQRVSVFPSPEGDPHPKRKMVVNQKFEVTLNHTNGDTGSSDVGERMSLSKAFLYTGWLDAAGQPHDDKGILRFEDGQEYKGNVYKGQRHGSGINRWPDGQKYDGEWRHDSRYGRGAHTWNDGRTVAGSWKDGHLHGRLFYRWPNGAVFDGNANMGKKEGRGVSTRSDGSVYNGNYKNGKENGFGTVIRPDGVKFRGHFRDGKKEGYGVMLWQTRTYEGEWSNDKPHGRGRVVWSNGAVFSGRFQQGSFSGMGVYTWPSGEKYVGMWENGAKSGHGTHTWPCGKKYDGHYTNGRKEGYGRMSWPDGSAYCGGFRHNKRYGRGIQTDRDGAVVHCGLWKDNIPLDEAGGTTKLPPVVEGGTPGFRLGMKNARLWSGSSTDTGGLESFDHVQRGENPLLSESRQDADAVHHRSSICQSSGPAIIERVCI